MTEKEMQDKIDLANGRAEVAEGKAETADQKATAAETRATEAETAKTESDTKATEAAARADELEAAITEATADIEGLEIPEDATAADRVTALRTHISSLAPDAAQVADLKSRAIDDAVKSGVRAFGDKFDEEKKRATLGKLSIDEIVEQGDEWEARAGGKYPTGRKSKETGEDDPDAETRPRSIEPEIPASAFSAL